jgi:hypothetical protein
LIINKKCVTIVFLRTMKIASGQKVFWGWMMLIVN